MLVGQMLVCFSKQHHSEEVLQRNTKTLCTSTGLPLSATAYQSPRALQQPRTTWTGIVYRAEGVCVCVCIEVSTV